MFCRNCSHELSQDAVICVACGVPPSRGNRFCQNCKSDTDIAAEICVKCGVRLLGGLSPQCSRVAAGVLGLTLGTLGIHRFYLGHNALGIAHLALAVAGLATCGVSSLASWIWGLIDGIRILSRSITSDAKGNPLRD